MKLLRFPLFLALLGLLLAACGAPVPATAELPPTAAAPTVPPTATVAPSATPPPEMLLLVGTNDAAARDWLAAQAAAAGLAYAERPALAAGELPAEARVVVWYDPPADLGGLPAAAPQTQFLVITSAALEPAANLTVLHKAAEQLAFAAGNLAVLLSDDWRSAGLIPSDQPALARAFLNGGGYFCGDCAPGWPLGSYYPQVGVAAAGADGAAWAADVNTLFDNGKAEVFYLSAAAYHPEVYAALVDRVQVDQTVIVLGELPPPAELQGQWAATLGVDTLAPLRAALPELLAGKSAGSLSAAVTLSDVNPSLLGAGRQALFEKTLTELSAGRIRIGEE